MKHSDHQKYVCPMHAQIVQDGPGKCPICGMNLVPLKKSDSSPTGPNHIHSHPHDHTTPRDHRSDGDQYYCPMLCEGDKKYLKPGDCPVCGMHLVKEQKLKTNSIEYTCPMHPEIVRSEPGSCPICGMDLVPRIIQKDNEEEEAAYKAMLKRFWVATVLTIPVFIIAMAEMAGSQIASTTTWGWIQFILATPVLIYCSGDFFKRGYLSVIRWSPNMWTLISLGAGAAYLFSIVALVFPDLFQINLK